MKRIHLALLSLLIFCLACEYKLKPVGDEDLKKIVCETLSFETPLAQVEDNIYSLELFHGPTLAFKDVGARFMARLLQYFIRKEKGDSLVNVLVVLPVNSSVRWEEVVSR